MIKKQNCEIDALRKKYIYIALFNVLAKSFFFFFTVVVTLDLASSVLRLRDKNT